MCFSFLIIYYNFTTYKSCSTFLISFVFWSYVLTFVLMRIYAIVSDRC